MHFKQSYGTLVVTVVTVFCSLASLSNGQLVDIEKNLDPQLVNEGKCVRNPRLFTRINPFWVRCVFFL